MEDTNLPHDNPDVPKDPSFSSWPLTSVVRELLLHPERVLSRYRQGDIKQADILLKSLMFLLFTSIFFASTAVVYVPDGVYLSPMRLLIRFFFFFSMMLLLVVPVSTLGWSLLQKFSSWFWNFHLPFSTILAISGLGILYYTLLFLISIPLLFLKPLIPYLIEGLLFLLNVTACTMSVRLFKRTYEVFSDASPGKALIAALFPIGVVVVVYLATAVLTFFAVQFHPM